MSFLRLLCLCGAGGVKVSSGEEGFFLTCIECKESAGGLSDDEALQNWNAKNSVAKENIEGEGVEDA